VLSEAISSWGQYWTNFLVSNFITFCRGKLLALTEKYQRGLLSPKQMDVELSSVKLPDLSSVVSSTSKASKEDEEKNGKAIITVQLETEANGLGSRLSKRKCVNLYSSECSLNGDHLTLESGENGGKVQFAVSHSSCPKLALKLQAVGNKKGNKLSSTLGAWFGNGCRRRASIALSETPIDLFALTSFANASSTANGGSNGNNSANGDGASSSSNESLSISHRLAVNQKDTTAAESVLLSELKLNLTNERLGAPVESKFRIQPGSFYDCVIPEDVESLWGPIPLQKLPRGVSNKCRAVTHG